MSLRMFWRKFVNALMLSLTGLCALIAVSVLFFILGYLVYHGGSDLNWDFFTKMPKPVGETGGGMANAMVGTAYLIAIAGGFAVPVGVIAGVYLSEYGKKSFGSLVRFTADVLNGVPSIRSEERRVGK